MVNNSLLIPTGEVKKNESQVQPIQFGSYVVPLEVIFHIFSYLAALDLGKMACVSKQMKEWSEDPSIWKNLILRSFLDRYAYRFKNRGISPSLLKMSHKMTYAFLRKIPNLAEDGEKGYDVVYPHKYINDIVPTCHTVLAVIPKELSRLDLAAKLQKISAEHLKFTCEEAKGEEDEVGGFVNETKYVPIFLKSSTFHQSQWKVLEKIPDLLDAVYFGHEKENKGQKQISCIQVAPDYLLLGIYSKQLEAFRKTYQRYKIKEIILDKKAKGERKIDVRWSLIQVGVLYNSTLLHTFDFFVKAAKTNQTILKISINHLLKKPLTCRRDLFILDHKTVHELNVLDEKNFLPIETSDKSQMEN